MVQPVVSKRTMFLSDVEFILPHTLIFVNSNVNSSASVE